MIQQTFHNLVSIGLVEEEGNLNPPKKMTWDWWHRFKFTVFFRNTYFAMNAAATCSQQDPLFHEINSTNTVIAYSNINIYILTTDSEKKRNAQLQAASSKCSDSMFDPWLPKIHPTIFLCSRPPTDAWWLQSHQLSKHWSRSSTWWSHLFGISYGQATSQAGDMISTTTGG